MTVRENIRELIEPRKPHYYSRLYDYLMLLAIAMGVFPLMFRTQYRLFWYLHFVTKGAVLLTL